MEVTFGPCQGGTPIGNRDSLIKLAAERNEYERKVWEAKQKKLKEEKERANNAQNG